MSAPKNVANPEALDAALLKLCADQPQVVQVWIKGVARKHLLENVSCFRRMTAGEIIKAFKANPWMLKAFGSNPVFEFEPEDSDYVQFTEELEHALPYLHSLLALGNKNLGGTSFSKAVNEGERMMERQKIEEKFVEGPDDKKLVHKYGNGFAWWSLKTQKALKNESTHMNHCVGRLSSYLTNIQSGEIEILSLRDAENVPHATIELNGKFLRQLKGNSNQGVGPKYKAACVGLIRDLVLKGRVNKANGADMEASGITPTDVGLTDFE